MALTASQLNPFMLMLNPEVVLAAIEKSERLGQLKSRLCRPLDRIPAAAIQGAAAANESLTVDEDPSETVEQ